MALRTALDPFAPPRGQPSAQIGALSLGEVAERALRRRVKRRAAVAEVLHAKLLGLDSPPPDPEDITISKRSWEHAYRKWKLAVRVTASAESA